MISEWSHKIEDHDHISLAITECEEILINSLTCPVSPTEIIYLFEDAIAVQLIHITQRNICRIIKMYFRNYIYVDIRYVLSGLSINLIFLM